MKRALVRWAVLACAACGALPACAGKSTESSPSGSSGDATTGGSVGSGITGGSAGMSGQATVGGSVGGGLTGGSAGMPGGGAGQAAVGGAPAARLGPDGCPLSDYAGSACVPPNTPDKTCGAMAKCKGVNDPNFIVSGNFTTCVNGVWVRDASERVCDCSAPELAQTPECKTSLVTGDADCPKLAPTAAACATEGQTCSYRGVVAGISELGFARCSCHDGAWSCVALDQNADTACPAGQPSAQDSCPPAGTICKYALFAQHTVAACSCAPGAGGASGAGGTGGAQSNWICGL